MKTFAQDIHPDAEKVLIELLRNVPPWKKCRMVSQMIQTLRELSLVGLKMRYPEASNDELLRHMAALWLPREFVIKVYGWDPEKEGY